MRTQQAEAAGLIRIAPVSKTFVAAVTIKSGSELVTLLAKANGQGFYWEANRPLAGPATRLLLRDFNGDGKLDAVGLVGTDIYSYPGLGNGKFGQAKETAGTINYGYLAADTLRRGGALDIFGSSGQGNFVLFNTTK